MLSIVAFTRCLCISSFLEAFRLQTALGIFQNKVIITSLFNVPDITKPKFYFVVINTRRLCKESFVVPRRLKGQLHLCSKIIAQPKDTFTRFRGRQKYFKSLVLLKITLIVFSSPAFQSNFANTVSPPFAESLSRMRH